MDQESPRTLAWLCGLALAAVALPLAFFALWARIDSLEDLAFARAMDLFIGLAFGAIVLLLGAGARSRWTLVGGAVAVCVLVSGLLLFWHDLQVRMRSAGPGTRAMIQVMAARGALKKYAKDCGQFPPEEKGLAALVTDPGVRGWAGPYVPVSCLTDPWGNPLQYRLRGNQVEVWSNGPDGVSGTDDDIRVDDEGKR
jgi:general secretion pathway protein G